MSNHDAFSLEQPNETAHVIVCGNEKGGSGKTTTAMHVLVYLLQQGFRVATIDLDSRQGSFSQYIENRKIWSDINNIELGLPTHNRFQLADKDSVADGQQSDFTQFIDAVAMVEHDHDFIIIDTPGSDNYIMRLAHSMADTLITPTNDSFLDVDVLGQVDGDTLEIKKISHYASMVRDARRQRRIADNGILDWVIVRNRVAPLNTINGRRMADCVRELSMRLGFRTASGIKERVIFREYFPMGLTALDNPQGIPLSYRKSTTHRQAREEIEQLIKALKLPIDDAANKRAEARRHWLETPVQTIELPDIFAD